MPHLSRQGAIALAEAAGKALAHLDRLAETYGDEPPIGSVIRWQKVYGDGKTYSYAAIRTEVGWFTTGPRAPKGYDWDSLTSWIDAGGTAFNFSVLAGPFGPQMRTAIVPGTFHFPPVPENISDPDQDEDDIPPGITYDTDKEDD